MRAECQFARAGQGLFYNGFLIDKNGHSFSFVYDCGTSGAVSLLENSVDEYKSFIKKKLDVLFVSHLHRDHISHIPKLIENMELNQVVLPGVIPEIRLLLASRVDCIETNSELIALYGDPVKYFAERGANRITILNSNNENNESLFSIEDDDSYRNDYKKNNSDNESEDRNTIVAYSRSGSIDNKKLFNANVEERKGVACFFIPHYSWEFRAANIHYQRYDNSFLEEVRKMLADNGNSFNTLLRNPEQVKRLRTIYDDHFAGKLNDTSVIVRSRPVHRGYILWNDGGSFDFRHIEDTGFFSKYFDKYGHAETLLLGDITMDFKILDRLIYQHLDNIRFLPRVIQLPHHGARMHCHPMCCDLFQHVGRNRVRSEFVASYGLTNSYGHPDLLCHRKCQNWCFDIHASFRLVNERRDFSYTVLFEE